MGRSNSPECEPCGISLEGLPVSMDAFVVMVRKVRIQYCNSISLRLLRQDSLLYFDDALLILTHRGVFERCQHLQLITFNTKMAYRFAPLLAGSATFVYQQRQAAEMHEVSAEPRRAICIMDSQPNEVAKGVVYFEQKSVFEQTTIRGEFKNLTPSHRHGFHIHVYGNLLKGCATAGPHYNPHGHTHGGPEKEVRHVGDLGNVQSDAEGNGLYEHTDAQVHLFGAYSVIGRSCVLHKSTDDLGEGGNAESLKTGNAGARIACGVIGRAE